MLLRFKSTCIKSLLVLTAMCCWSVLDQVQAKILFINIQEITPPAEVKLDGLHHLLSCISIAHLEQDSVKVKTRSKVIAAILAFPYPFGMLGLHRVYLGANPGIPILYFVTFGGFVGILPFVDMMVIILSKDTSPFVKNSKMLMWYRKGS